MATGIGASHEDQINRHAPIVRQHRVTGDPQPEADREAASRRRSPDMVIVMAATADSPRGRRYWILQTFRSLAFRPAIEDAKASTMAALTVAITALFMCLQCPSELTSAYGAFASYLP
jgi:hypothetical protein